MKNQQENLDKMNNNYGLSKTILYTIINVFKNYSNIIEKVLIFGSRARGDYKKTSDIDLAIKFRSNNEKIYNIIGDIENKKIIYTLDVIDYDKISNEKLKKYIDNEGKIIFLTDEKGGVKMNLNKVKDKLEDLNKAFLKLQESASRNPDNDDIIIDATIQRFEFTYELSWKLMKAYLEYNGNLEATSPRKAIKEAFKSKLIDDGEIWLEMLDDRNRTSHTYDENCAKEIFDNINNNYIESFQTFINNISKEI